jgi:hypothetical protein
MFVFFITIIEIYNQQIYATSNCGNGNKAPEVDMTVMYKEVTQW